MEITEKYPFPIFIKFSLQRTQGNEERIFYIALSPKVINQNVEKMRGDMVGKMPDGKGWELAIRLLLNIRADVPPSDYTRDLCLSYLASTSFADIGYGDVCDFLLDFDGLVSATLQRRNGIKESIKLGSLPLTKVGNNVGRL